LLRSLDRLVASARATATDRFCAATVARLDQGAADRLERLVADVDPTSPGPGRGSRSWPSSKLTPAGPAWRRCSARWTSSKIYSRLALADAQQRYDQVITRAPSDPRRYLAAWATFGRTGPTRTRMANFTERGHVRANSRSRQESKIVKCYLQPLA